MALATACTVSPLPRIVLAGALACAGGVQLAHADVYTWTDATGRLNVSNIAPPEGVRVTRVVHENPPPPEVVAARAAARTREVQALSERVAQLEDEVERAQRQAPPPGPYRVVTPPAAPTAPVHVAVTVMQPPPQYPSPPTPYGGECDPGTFGCTAFGYTGFGYPGFGYPGFGYPGFGYPASIVVLRDRGFHHFDHFHQSRAAHRAPAAHVPMRSGGVRQR